MAKSRTQTPAPPTIPLDPSYPPLPSPSHFDILPPLHALLSRLDPTLNTYTPDPTAIATTPALAQSASTSPTQPPGGSSLPGSGLPDGNNAGSLGVGAEGISQGQGSQGAGGQAGLSYKDAALAAGFLKSRIRKLMQELAGLEDMDRTVEEQEREIAELEERVRGQREVLAALGDEAGRVLGEVERARAGAQARG
ncbi:hypothetical protein BDZ85DRAFT_321925 [Elsinoe ampelina]|uniref:Mediator of RNA polymerase II transcription subunit 9 n=1 Tax=Elsinoe ampelina TaxID=302913 RepID=A0A6A6G2K6_9PEZI|nr:hypothetical protein BDZ85DRAFT_321925 [Elsinoe ampelina]